MTGAGGDAALRSSAPTGGPVVAAVRLPLIVRNLRHGDLPHCLWSGSPVHLVAVEAALDRAADGAVDFLAVCGPADLPLSMGAVDHTKRADAGLLWMLATHPAVRSCGLGTVLVRALEARVGARGSPWAELTVEDDNPRAHALYRRLGYVVTGEEDAEWDDQAPDGSVFRYRTHCQVLRRRLS